MTSASIECPNRARTLRGRLLYGQRRARRQWPSGLVRRVRRAARRPADRERGLQGHQGELAPQLGTRRREELVPKPMLVGERTLEHSGSAGVLLKLRKRRSLQPLDIDDLEDRTAAALDSRYGGIVPRGKKDLQPETVLRLVEIHAASVQPDLFAPCPS